MGSDDYRYPVYAGARHDDYRYSEYAGAGHDDYRYPAQKQAQMQVQIRAQKKAPVLKTALSRYAQDTITEEQIGAVLAPVLKEIDEGKFDSNHWARISWLMWPLIALAAVAMLIIAIAMVNI